MSATRPAPAFGPASPRLLLRAEGLAVALVGLAFYRHQGGGWPMLLLLFLVPDLSLLGLLAGPRVGSTAYNLVHNYLGPALLLAVGRIQSLPLPQLLAAIWAVHIGLDRALGFGLRYPDAARENHLGRV